MQDWDFAQNGLQQVLASQSHRHDSSAKPIESESVGTNLLPFQPRSPGSPLTETPKYPCMTNRYPLSGPSIKRHQDMGEDTRSEDVPDRSSQ